MEQSSVRTQSPTEVLWKRIWALMWQPAQCLINPAIEYSGLDRPCPFGDIRHVHDPIVHLTVHGFTGQTDLNGSPWLRFQLDRPVRIPPHTHRALGSLRLPLSPALVHTRLEVAEGRVCQRPFEPGLVHVDSQNSFLVRLPGPVGRGKPGSTMHISSGANGLPLVVGIRRQRSRHSRAAVLCCYERLLKLPM